MLTYYYYLSKEDLVIVVFDGQMTSAIDHPPVLADYGSVDDIYCGFIQQFIQIIKVEINF